MLLYMYLPTRADKLNEGCYIVHARIQTVPQQRSTFIIWRLTLQQLARAVRDRVIHVQKVRVRGHRVYDVYVIIIPVGVFVLTSGGVAHCCIVASLNRGRPFSMQIIVPAGPA